MIHTPETSQGTCHLKCKFMDQFHELCSLLDFRFLKNTHSYVFARVNAIHLPRHCRLSWWKSIQIMHAIKMTFCKKKSTLDRSQDIWDFDILNLTFSNLFIRHVCPQKEKKIKSARKNITVAVKKFHFGIKFEICRLERRFATDLRLLIVRRNSEACTIIYPQRYFSRHRHVTAMARKVVRVKKL